MEKKKIVFTGGGSAGHVTPNMAIMAELDRNEWDIHYIGSKTGIEKYLMEQKMMIPYHAISSGKLRRYVDWENVKDTFRVMKGVLDARKVLRKLRPKLVFSKGGFVSVPVVLAAYSLGIPCFIHESDLTPGLANKIAQRFATKIFTSFEEAAKHFPAGKTQAIGSPIRRELFDGSRADAVKLLGFSGKKPIISIMGGSLGAQTINDFVRNNLQSLTERYEIIHLCGKDHLVEELDGYPGYVQMEYAHDELTDILAATDDVITRGGSNAIFEFLALRIPMLIIPLPRKSSRGDQILNAENFAKKGYAITVKEEELTDASFLAAVEQLFAQSERMKATMASLNPSHALEHLLAEIEAVYA